MDKILIQRVDDFGDKMEKTELKATAHQKILEIDNQIESLKKEKKLFEKIEDLLNKEATK